MGDNNFSKINLEFKLEIKNHIWLGLVLIMLSAFSGLTAEILNPAEQHQLVEMLNTAGFDSTDVNFLKDWDPTTKFKLSCQVDVLNNPWNFFKFLDYLKGRLKEYSSKDYTNFPGEKGFSSDQNTILSEMLTIMNKKFAALPEVESYGFSVSDPVMEVQIKTPDDIIDYAKEMIKHFDSDRKVQTVQSQAELDSLSLFLFQIWQESEDSLEYKEFYKQNFPNLDTNISLEAGIKLIEKYCVTETSSFATTNNLRQEEKYYTPNIPDNYYEFYALCNSLAEQVKHVKFTNKKPIIRNTKYGTIIIGSPGNDRYSDTGLLHKSPPCIIIEPGGDDVYECPLYADSKHPFYVVIDLEGNDIYRNKDIGKELFVNNGGFGYLQDFEGDDTYSGGDFSLSALWGMQINKDDKGNDTYTGGLYTQGAAMFGLSLLQDNDGNDTYTATEFAQGMGGTQGFGLLLDGKGNDVYYTGGKYLHTPLAPFDYRSMAQGFGFGMRPDLAGGIGILYDGEGNDRYSGGVYAQGVAYWYAIGALFDEKGNDYYDAVYYPQGSGIHLANGALIDMEGEDHYYSKHGPGQGNGHDWSVGVFVDKAGNDEYSIEGGNGLGLTNSVGIFVDSQGNDKYEARNSSNYGYANAARETAGIGLFLDAGGTDSYPDSTKADNKTWQQGTYGIGQDIELNKLPQTKMEELAEQSTADVDSLASIVQLFDMAAEWEVGSATKKVMLARDFLLKRDKEAVPYVIKTKMATKSGLEYRALEELTKQSKLMQTSLYAVLHDADSLKVKNAMALISGLKDSLSVDSIAVFLKMNKYIPTTLSCLGSFKTAKALDLIRPWLSHPFEKYRYLAARSLKTMNTPEAIAELRKMANDKSFLIKAMVRQLPASGTVKQ
jgi:hypothetical protein